MTSEQIVQQMLEASYTGSEVMYLMTVFTISLAALVMQLVFVYGGYRLIKHIFDKLKNLRERRFDTRED